MSRVRRLTVYIMVSLIQLFRVLYYRMLFSDNTPTLNGSKTYHPVRYCGKGAIVLDRCKIGVYRSPDFVSGASYIEARLEGSNVFIGEDTHINNGICIIAYGGSVHVGKRCLIGVGVTIINSDFHKVNYGVTGVEKPSSFNVWIGDDVFIGNDVTILKGVTIGDGAVIGAGTVVAHSIPSGCVFKSVECVKHEGR